MISAYFGKRTILTRTIRHRIDIVTIIASFQISINEVKKGSIAICVGIRFIPIAIGNCKKHCYYDNKMWFLTLRRGVASTNIIATDFNPLKTPEGKDKEP